MWAGAQLFADFYISQKAEIQTILQYSSRHENPDKAMLSQDRAELQTTK